jgi:hypothetical protein
VWKAGVDEERQVGEVFGPPEDWQLKLGRFTLMLDPVERKWFYHDGIHDVWQPTGVGIGEAVFGVANTVLGWKQVEPGKPAPTPSGPPPPPPAPTQPAARFCHSCGGKLVAGAKFCSYCGTQVPGQEEE